MNSVQTHKLTGSPKVWAVGGGKGGVGKSLVSILLAISLARLNKKTILVDADLGGANLHTLMGIKTPARTLNDFVNRKFNTIEDICTRTSIDNLRIICGASEILSLANPQYAQKSKIMQGLLKLPADHVLLDLGAGTSYNVLDFFLIAHNPIVVVTPQPISIQNAYAFVRNAVYRKLSRMASQKASLQHIIKTAMDPKNEKRMRTITDLYDAVAASHGQKVCSQIKTAVGSLTPYIVTNMAQDQRDYNAGKIIQLVAEKYLTIRVEDLGAIDHDPVVASMVAQMMPLTDLSANCRACDCAKAVVNRLESVTLNEKPLIEAVHQ